MNMIVLDTNVLVAALRSRKGASRNLLRGVLSGRWQAGVSVPLFLEYEAVLGRPECLAAFGLSRQEVDAFLDGMASVLLPVEISYLWRPQLRDANDEMVLEAAANGAASHLLTWNIRDFLPAALKFDIRVVTPSEFLQVLPKED
jgi:putative PIN family toxin of toxin-antitoxin system